MSQVRVAQIDLLYYLTPQPQVRVAQVELVSGTLPPTRFRLTVDGWVPDDTELI